MNINQPIRTCLLLILIFLCNPSHANLSEKAFSSLAKLSGIFKHLLYASSTWHEMRQGNTGSPAETFNSIKNELATNASLPDVIDCTLHCADFAVYTTHAMSLANPRKDGYQLSGMIDYEYTLSNGKKDSHIAPMIESSGTLYMIDEPSLRADGLRSLKLNELPETLSKEGHTDIKFRIIYDMENAGKPEILWGIGQDLPTSSSPRHTEQFTSAQMNEQISITLDRIRTNRLKVIPPTTRQAKQALLSLVHNAANIRDLINGNITEEVFAKKQYDIRSHLANPATNIRHEFNLLTSGEHKLIMMDILGRVPLSKCRDQVILL